MLKVSYKILLLSSVKCHTTSKSKNFFDLNICFNGALLVRNRRTRICTKMLIHKVNKVMAYEIL